MDDSQAAPAYAPPGRSQASHNWRTKDDAPRAEPQGQYRTQRNYNQNRSEGQGEASVPENRLYVGNLLYTAQRNDVEAFFIDNGFQITGISMSIDPFTNRNKSYAFVDFETVDEANRALDTLNGQELMGRQVRINHGMRKEGGAQQGGYQTRGQGGQGFGGQSGYGQQGYGSQNRGYQDRGYQNRGPSQGGENASNGYNKPTLSPTRLYVGGLPQIDSQEALEADLKQLFQAYQVKSVSRLISPHESKVGEPGNHYYCFVDFETPEDADRALEEHAGKESPYGGELRINKARDNRQKRQYGGNREGGYGRPNAESGGFGGGDAGWR